jgi:SAM-dependent methyltransferase
MTAYSSTFYRQVHAQVRDSAREIVPLVTALIEPKRVVDVGCGTGTWLATFAEHGATDVLGLDGDYVDRSLLDIPSDRFIAADLSKPVRMAGRYDLAVCLEVAEHLPEASADALVELLTSLAPCVLFSAAIPFQGGVNHLNEQWPEYWAARFSARTFLPIDCLRRKIWCNEKVAWFYAQNVLLFAEERYANDHPALARELTSSGGPLSLVHPSCFLMRVWQEHDLANRPLRQVLAALPGLSKNAVSRRLGRVRAAR